MSKDIFHTAREDELINSVLIEMKRVWGPEGFSGSDEEYAWLLANYGITEEDDVRWADILEYFNGDLDSGSFSELEKDEKQEIMAFLKDDGLVCDFLTKLLRRYQSNTVTHNAAD